MPPQKEGKDGWRANLAQNSVLFGEIIYGKKFLLSFSVDWYSRKILFEHSTLSKFSTRLVRQTAWYFPHLSAPRPASASLQLGEGDIVPPAHCDSDDLQEHLILKTNRITDLPHDPVHFIRVIYSLGKSLLKGVLGSLPVTMPLKKMSLHVSPTIINCIWILRETRGSTNSLLHCSCVLMGPILSKFSAGNQVTQSCCEFKSGS